MAQIRDTVQSYGESPIDLKRGNKRMTREELSRSANQGGKGGKLLYADFQKIILDF